MESAEGLESALLDELRSSSTQEQRQAVLARLLEPHLDRIARWAKRMRHDPDAAADLAQDALAAVCAQAHLFRGECRFTTWVYSILRNLALKQGEKEARRSRLLAEQPASAPRPGDAEREAVARLGVVECHRMVKTELTPVEARIFLLHFAHGVPVKEIGRRLQLTNRSGAKAYLVAARRKLEKALSRRAARRVAPAGDGRANHER